MFKNKIIKMGVLVLMIDLASVAGWWMFYNEIKNIDRRIVLITQNISFQDAKQRNIKQLDQTLLSIVSEKSKIDGVFADSGSVVEFIEHLEELAVLSGAGLEILSGSFPAKAEEGGPFFTLNLSGSFGRIFKFLSLVEKTGYQTRIEGAKFNASDSGGWTSQVRLRMMSYKF